MTGPSQKDLLKTSPSLCEGGNVRAASLEPREAFLLSQVDGVTPARVLSDVVAMGLDELIEALSRLEARGLIRWAQRLDPARAPGSDNGDTAQQRAAHDVSADNPGLQEDCDLSRDERLHILQAAETFPKKTHWEILGVNGDASPADIKRAYFKASKAFHPDRYFGRRLGSFTGRLETVFMFLKKAHDTLSEPESRRVYAAKCPPPVARAVRPATVGSTIEPSGSGGGEELAEKERRLEARRQQILAERKQRRRARFAKVPAASAPKAGQDRRAEELYQAGLAQLRSNDVFAAVASFRLALTFEPDNDQYRATFEEANRQAMLERAREVAANAEAHVSSGALKEAGELYAKAFEMTPNKAEYAMNAAEQFLALNRFEDAVRLASQAVEVAPSRVGPRLLAARALEKAGEPRAALEHLQRAESLDGADARVKRAMRRLGR